MAAYIDLNPVRAELVEDPKDYRFCGYAGAVVGSSGAILGSKEFVHGFTRTWQLEKRRKYPPKPNLLRGADWQGLATINGLRKQVFG